MKVISGILRGLSLLVTLAIVAALLIAAPLLFGNQPMIVLSGSMEPAYPVGSITYYKQAPFEEIEIGDTITFGIGESSLATHRVVDKDTNAGTFTTKGDANDTQDANPVSYQQVKGKTAAFAIPYAGFFVDFLQNWYAIAACAGVLVLDGLFGRDNKKDKKETTEDSQMPQKVVYRSSKPKG